MGIIEVKRNEVAGQAKEVIYDGRPTAFRFNLQATYITRLYKGVENALRKVGRTLDNLYIAKDGSNRWYLFSSHGDGTADVLFYFFFDAYGFKAYIYVGWQKLKVDDFISMPDDEQARLLSDTSPADIAAVWRKDRSVDTMGSLLATLPKDQADAGLRLVGKKLLSNIEKADINDRNITRVSSLVSSLRKIGTSDSMRFISRVEDVFKTGAIKHLLTDMKAGNYRTAKKELDSLESFGWSELESIKRSLTALGYYQAMDESYTSEHPAIVQAKRVLADEVPGGNFWALGRAIGHMKTDNISPEQIRKVLEWHRQEIVQSQEFLLSQEMSEIQGGLSNMVDLVEVGIDWPELDGIPDRNKDGIMHAVLWEVAHIPSDYDPLLYTYLVQLGIKWDEMEIIKRSLDANKKVVKEGRETEQYGYPASAVMDRIRDDHPLALYHGMQDLRYDGVKDSIILGALERYDEDIAIWMDALLLDAPTAARIRQVANFMMMGANWPSVRSSIEKHRDLIIRLLLEEYKQAVESTSWRSVNLSKLAGRMHLIRQAGYDWPEIRTIEQSAKSMDR